MTIHFKIKSNASNLLTLILIKIKAYVLYHNITYSLTKSHQDQFSRSGEIKYQTFTNLSHL